MDSIRQWRRGNYLSLDPIPLKFHCDIRSFFHITEDSRATTHWKRKRETSKSSSPTHQGVLTDFRFTHTLPPSPPPTKDNPPEYVLPPSIVEKLQKRAAHKNRSLTPQSKSNLTYQQRLRSFSPLIAMFPRKSTFNLTLMICFNPQPKSNRLPPPPLPVHPQYNSTAQL